MRFLLDVDGVVADLIGYLLDDLESKFDNVIKYEDIKTFLLTDSLDEDQMKRVVDLLTEPGTAQKIPVVPGSQEGVAKILAAGHEIHWITSRWRPSQTWVYDRDQWLAKHFNVDPKFVSSIHHKHIVSGDIFIDDRTSNIVRWKEANPKGMPLLFKHPWNKNVKGIPFFNGWQDIDKILQNLE